MQRQSSVFAARLFLVFEEALKILRLRHKHQAGTLLLFTESFGKKRTYANCPSLLDIAFAAVPLADAAQ
jgi:hypothetical protein